MNNAFMYDVTPYVAEIYDQSETYTDDVELIQTLIQGSERLHILEPFCGTGRILIPLALAGHTIVGLDSAAGMLLRARGKIQNLDTATRSKISLIQANVVEQNWPPNFDLVILGGNCFYELSSPEEQEQCIMHAASALKPGGHLYVDNNHMEGELDLAWQIPGIRAGFPTGICADGASVESWTETIWFDVPNRLAKFRRLTKVTFPDGKTIEREYFQQKHPVSATEVQSWLEAHGFRIEKLYGDRKGSPYTAKSDRAIFWAKKV